jgi:hypothetical protein
MALVREAQAGDESGRVGEGAEVAGACETFLEAALVEEKEDLDCYWCARAQVRAVLND